MTAIKQRRLKIISFTLNGTEYSAQITSWKVSAGIKTGNRVYTFNVTGEGTNSFVEETDGEPSLDIKFLADWTVGGLSDYLWVNNMAVVPFVISNHPDITGEKSTLSGTVQLQAPDAGGDARSTEEQEVTLPIIGAIPTYTHVG